MLKVKWIVGVIGVLMVLEQPCKAQHPWQAELIAYRANFAFNGILAFGYQPKNTWYKAGLMQDVSRSFVQRGPKGFMLGASRAFPIAKGFSADVSIAGTAVFNRVEKSEIFEVLLGYGVSYTYKQWVFKNHFLGGSGTNRYEYFSEIKSITLWNSGFSFSVAYLFSLPALKKAKPLK